MAEADLNKSINYPRLSTRVYVCKPEIPNNVISKTAASITFNYFSLRCAGSSCRHHRVGPRAREPLGAAPWEGPVAGLPSASRGAGCWGPGNPPPPGPLEASSPPPSAREPLPTTPRLMATSPPTGGLRGRPCRTPTCLIPDPGVRLIPHPAHLWTLPPGREVGHPNPAPPLVPGPWPWRTLLQEPEDFRREEGGT